MKNAYIIDYINENEFRKKERSLKKYNMLAYKKLMFEHYPNFKEGLFDGEIVSTNQENAITKYLLKLPTDQTFSKVHGDIKLSYSVYENQKIVMLHTLTPEEILTEGHQSELTTYKGVMVSNAHKEQDMFKINLFNAMRKDGFTKLATLITIIAAFLVIGLIILIVK